MYVCIIAKKEKQFHKSVIKSVTVLAKSRTFRSILECNLIKFLYEFYAIFGLQHVIHFTQYNYTDN